MKLPGDDGAAGGGGAGGGVAEGVDGMVNLPDGPAASGFFSIATCTNALASSRDAFIEPGAAGAAGCPGVFSACSMRVNSPGLPAAGGSGAGGPGGADAELENDACGAGAGGGDENTGA